MSAPSSRGSLLALLAFAVLAGLVYARREDAEAIEGGSPLIGQSSPPLEGLADAKGGRLTLVNFFASWCGPCRAEHPVLMALAREGRLRLVGVSYKDRPADAAAFLASHGDPFAVIGADPSGLIGARWGLRGVPQSFLIDASGRVLDDFLGPMGPQALARLKSLIPPPPAASAPAASPSPP